MEVAVKQANCWFDCLDKLGVPKVGYNYRTLKNKILEYGIDTSHFSYNYAKTHNGGTINEEYATGKMKKSFLWEQKSKWTISRKHISKEF